MKKIFTRIFPLSLLLLSSCIKGEPRNTEADIVRCILPADILKSEPTIDDNSVQAFVVGGVDMKKLAPEFELTPGATISPESGTERDFTEDQQYTVTSEDGVWQKTYRVSITQSDMQTKYDFENWKKQGSYVIPYEIMGDQIQNIWSSGNSGFALTVGGGSYDKFQTAYTEESHSGQWAAKLVTRATGTFGVNLKMPIAAGNLFIGTFDGMSATKDPMKATRFGMTFGREPLRLTGYYRYQSGGDITDENNQLVVPARRDSCNIYAVLYETDDEVECLYGDNVLTSPNLVAVALVDQPEETDVYKKFDVEFEYRKPYDPQKSKEFKYKLAVVFTSSRDGGRFRGAVGSTLWIDDVEVVCREPLAGEQ